MSAFRYTIFIMLVAAVGSLAVCLIIWLMRMLETYLKDRELNTILKETIKMAKEQAEIKKTAADYSRAINDLYRKRMYTDTDSCYPEKKKTKRKKK